MIKLEIKESAPGMSLCTCGIEGSAKKLTTEAIEAVHAIYKAMAEDGGPAGALLMFQLSVMRAVGDPRSPVWDLSGKVSSVERKRESWPGEGMEGQS